MLLIIIITHGNLDTISNFIQFLYTYIYIIYHIFKVLNEDHKIQNTWRSVWNQTHK